MSILLLRQREAEPGCIICIFTVRQWSCGESKCDIFTRVCHGGLGWALVSQHTSHVIWRGSASGGGGVEQTPLPTWHYVILLTSGQYASYCIAFLFTSWFLSRSQVGQFESFQDKSRFCRRNIPYYNKHFYFLLICTQFCYSNKGFIKQILLLWNSFGIVIALWKILGNDGTLVGHYWL